MRTFFAEITVLCMFVHDQGVKIDRDSHGNIYLTNLSNCEVIVNGYRHPENHCVADEVVQMSGRVGPEKTKVVVFNNLACIAVYYHFIVTE